MNQEARKLSQLSQQDAVFLYSDNAHANANITLLHIYDQSTAPGGVVRFKSILKHIENRLDRLPLLRQKLCRVPLGLDRPYWVDDEDFTLEYHVRHIALPKPGDWRQFCIQASRIHARPLDRHRPLWEMYVIEGLDTFLDLPPSSFAVLCKIHHAVIDVERGNEITALLHDIDQVPPAPDVPEPWFPEAPPGDTVLLARAALRTILFPLRRIPALARTVSSVVPAVLDRLREALKHPEQAVITRFNTVVSPHRVFETRRFRLDECKTIRSLVPDATVNDVVLAVCGGGLRRYLDLQGELPEGSLTATAPISVRSKGKQDFTLLRVRIGTDIADPVARLAAIRAQTATSTVISDAVSARELTDIARYAPGATLAVTSRMLGYATAQMGRWAPLANCSITNVPGPSVPLYLRGARLAYFSAIMPIADGMGLVFSVTSYDEMLIISFTGCYEQLPDPEVFAQCVRDSFQEYLAAAGLKNVTPISTVRRGGKRRKAA
jgi:WS/DGAT/MGAT family acyltransferase